MTFTRKFTILIRCKKITALCFYEKLSHSCEKERKFVISASKFIEYFSNKPWVRKEKLNLKILCLVNLGKCIDFLFINFINSRSATVFNTFLGESFIFVFFNLVCQGLNPKYITNYYGHKLLRIWSNFKPVFLKSPQD